MQPTGQLLGFNNTNALVKSADWDIQVSKTGFIREAGKCLVMMATISSRPVVIVLLDSLGRYTRDRRRRCASSTGSRPAKSMPVRTAKAAKPAKASPKKAGVKATSAKVAQAASVKAGKARRRRPSQPSRVIAGARGLDRAPSDFVA